MYHKLTNTGLIEVTGGTLTVDYDVFLNTGHIKVVDGATMVIESGITNNGLIQVDDATVTIAGPVSGTGADEIGGHAMLEFGGAVSAGQTVSFDADATGILRLDDSLHFKGAISGLAMNGGNALDLSDIGFISNKTTAAFHGGKLTVTDGGHTATLVLAGNYAGQSFVASSDGHGGTTVDLIPAAMLFPGAGGAVMPADLLPASGPLPGLTPPHPMAAAGFFSMSLPEAPVAMPAKTGWLTS